MTHQPVATGVETHGDDLEDDMLDVLPGSMMLNVLFLLGKIVKSMQLEVQEDQALFSVLPEVEKATGLSLSLPHITFYVAQGGSMRSDESKTDLGDRF